MTCNCDKPISDPDTMSCVRCGRPCLEAVKQSLTITVTRRVPIHDALQLHRRRVAEIAANQ